MRTVTVALIGLGLVLPLVAQEAPPGAAACPAGYTCTPAASPAAQLGLYAFPKAGQSKEQQLQDEQQCYGWAREQTGIDPKAVKANPDSAARAAKAKVDSSAGAAGVAGAARGAGRGAVVGAVAGDAGDGAKVGAVTGAIGARRRKRAAEQQAAQQAAVASNAQAAQLMETFKKAMSACLEGKNYSVK